MKKRTLVFTALGSAAGAVCYAKRNLVSAVFDLEKMQGDLFTRVKGENVPTYLCKNDSQSEELFQDWIAYNGWQKADQVGEGFFYINDAQDTLTLEREAVLSGRYIRWTASKEIEK
jgi:hypothetical protein